MGQCACVKSADRDAENSVVYKNSAASLVASGDLEQSTSTIIQWEKSGCASRPVDICGLKDNKFILVQSGTHWHYIEVVSLQNRVSTNNMIPLREKYTNGDHYLAQFSLRSSGGSHRARKVKNFYIIKGNSFIEVPWERFCNKKLRRWRQPSDRIFDLHPDCQGGSFYCANRAGFYIIHTEDNSYLQVCKMSKEDYQPSAASRHKLHETFTNGLYYFATDNYFYVLKENTDIRRLVYYRTKDLRSTAEVEILTVSRSITSLLRCSSINQHTSKACEESVIQSHKETPLPIDVEISSEAPRSINATPDQYNLHVIKWKNEQGEVKTFKLIASIVHKSREIGNLVNVPLEKLEVWAKEKDAEACCDAVFLHWLKNSSPNYPVTWEGLYELLRDCDLCQVADDLKEAVDNTIHLVTQV